MGPFVADLLIHVLTTKLSTEFWFRCKLLFRNSDSLIMNRFKNNIWVTPTLFITN
jgi:hypothetical protein